jgi:divalent metal cation (Fe/Co/Zn/Cd) transporter|tara:strand:- start:260 stop:487 length:228 start_codon:yes stop_codon:yes gene_type:complete
MIEKMAILQDSVLVGGFFFFLSTYLLWFSTKKINESQLKPNVKKNLNVLAFILMIIVVVIIFAYHSKHYMGSLSG